MHSPRLPSLQGCLEVLAQVLTNPACCAHAVAAGTQRLADCACNHLNLVSQRVVLLIRSLAARHEARSSSRNFEILFLRNLLLQRVHGAYTVFMVQNNTRISDKRGRPAMNRTISNVTAFKQLSVGSSRGGRQLDCRCVLARTADMLPQHIISASITAMRRYSSSGHITASVAQ